MAPRFKLAIALLINLSFIGNDVLAQLPPINFDAPQYVPWEPIRQQDPAGWTAISGTANVTGPG